METTKTFNVFIPYSIFQYSSCYIVGNVSFSTGMICVLGVTSHTVGNSRIIGYWNNKSSLIQEEIALNILKSNEHSAKKDGYPVLILKFDDLNNLSSKLYLLFDNSSHQVPSIIICFEPTDILQSYIFSQSHCLDNMFNESANCTDEEFTYKHFVKSLGHHIADSLNWFLCQSTLSGEVSLCKKQTSSIFTKVLQFLIWIFYRILIWVTLCFKALSSRLVCICSLID